MRPIIIKSQESGLLISGLRNHTSGFILEFEEAVRIFLSFQVYVDEYTQSRDSGKDDASFVMYGLSRGNLSLVIRETLEKESCLFDEGVQFFMALQEIMMRFIAYNQGIIAGVMRKNAKRIGTSTILTKNN